MANGQDDPDRLERLRALLGVPPQESPQDEDEERQGFRLSPEVDDSIIRAAPPDTDLPRLTGPEDEEEEGPGREFGLGLLRDFAGRAWEEAKQAPIFGSALRSLEEAPETVRGAAEDLPGMARALAGGTKALGEAAIGAASSRIQRQQRYGYGLERARQLGEPTPNILERTLLGEEPGPTQRAIAAEEERRTRDIQRGMARGTISGSTALARGTMKTLDPIPGGGAMTRGAEWLREQELESLRILGQTETPAGTASEVISRLGLELGMFMAGGVGVRSVSARMARARRTPEFVARGLDKVANPKTFTARLVEDVASGGPIDYLIAASGPENASVTFLAELTKNDRVRETLEARGFDPDEVRETLEGISESRWKRGLFEATVGTIFATAIHGAMATKRSITSAADESLQRLQRFQAEEAASRRQRAAEAEPRGEPPEEAPTPEEPVEAAAREAPEGRAPTRDVSAPEDEPFQITQAAFRIPREDGPDDIFTTGAVHDLDQIEDPARRRILMDAVAEGEAEAGYVTNRVDEETGRPEFLDRSQAQRLSGAESGESSVIAGTEAGSALRGRATQEAGERAGNPRFFAVPEEDGFRVFDSEAGEVDDRWPAFETEDQAHEAARRLNEVAADEARLGREVEAEMEAETPAEEMTVSQLREAGRHEEAAAKEADIEDKLAKAFGDKEPDADDFTTGAPESARAAEAEAETPDRAPEAREDVGEEPQRRLEQAGDREVGEAVPGITGRIRRVKNADGSELTAQYAVVEARHLRPSHDAGNFAPRADYPEWMQERGYHREDEAKQFLIDNARELDPDQPLDATMRPTDGPPIITIDGVALSGNARTMMIQRAYELHPERAAAYRQSLANRLDQYGLGGQGEAVRQMDAPVLVRRLVDEGVDQTDRRQLAELVSKFNDVPTRSRDVLGEAATRARRFLENENALDFYSRNIGPSQTLRDFLRSADGDRFVQMLRDEGTITPQEATRFRRPDGGLTDEGIQDIERMLFASVIDDPDVLARAPRSTMRDLTHAVPALVKAADVPGWDLGPRIRATLDYIRRFRDSDFTDFDEFVSQTGLFEGVDDQTKQLARFLEGENRSTIKSGFRKYAQDADESRRQRAAAGEEGGGDLFGNEPVTPEEAFQTRFVDKVFEPQIPGLRGNPTGEEGFVRPELLHAMVRSSTGAVMGASVGALFGDTPEERRRNAIIFGVAGGAGPKLIDVAYRRLSPPEWHLNSRAADEVSDAIKKGGPSEPNDPHALESLVREAYRRVWRARLPIEEFTEAVKAGIRGELPSSRDPAMLSTVAQGSMAHADQSYRLGVHRPGTNNFRTARGLYAVLQEVGGRMDDLRFYGMARRIVEDLEPRGLFEPEAAAGEQLDAIGHQLRQAAPFGPEKAREILRDYGRTYDEAGNVVDQGDEQLAGWFEEVQEIDDAWYVLLEQEGVLRQGAAARIRGENRNYWPFLRDLPGGGRQSEARRPMFGGQLRPARLEGSELPVLDPIESLIVQQFTYSDLIFRQRVLNSLVDLHDAAPDNPFMREIPKNEISERIRFSGEQLRGQIDDQILAEVKDETLEAWVPRRLSSDDPVIRVEDPEEGVRYFELSPHMVDAARSMQPEQIPTWLRLMKASARWLRTGVTMMPEFQFANLTRDVLFTAVTDPTLGAREGASTLGHAVAAPKAVAESGESAIQGIARLLADHFGTEPDELVQLWRASGGPFGAFQDMDRDVLASQLRRMRQAGDEINNVTDPIGALRAIGDRIRGATIMVENGPRFGKFIRDTEGGTRTDINTAIKAAAESRDITVDFSLRGSSQLVRDLAQMSAFWMARMSGLDKMRRAFAQNPKRFVGTALGSVTLFSMANYARNRNDPGYWQIPQFVKNFYWVVRLPDFAGEMLGEAAPDLVTQDPESGAAGKALKPVLDMPGGVWLRIPKPHEIGWIFGSMPERFVEALDPANPYRNDDIADAIGDVGKDISSMLMEFVPQPTAVTTFVENFFNYDFFLGRPLISPYEEVQDKADRLKGRDQASRMARAIGDVLDVAPPTVDNVVNDWFGTAGRLGTETIDYLGRPKSEGATPDTPLGQGFPEKFVIGRFVREESNFSPRSVDEFYEVWQEANGAFASQKEYVETAQHRAIRLNRAGERVQLHEMPEMQQAQQIVRGNLERLLKRDVYNNIADRIAMLRKQREVVEKDTKLGPQEKRALMDQISMKMGFLTSLAVYTPDARDDLFKRYEVPEDYGTLRDKLEMAEEAAEQLREQARVQSMREAVQEGEE